MQSEQERLLGSLATALMTVLCLMTIGCGGGFGTVASSPASSLPAASLSTTSLDFGNQTLGSNSSKTVTLSNVGNGMLTITGISATGDFALTNNCGSTVAVKGSCTIVVTFRTTKLGPQAGTLSIADNASGSPHLIALTGNAVAQAGLSFSPTSINFGTLAVGGTTSRQIQISNVSTASLPIASASTSGPGFSISGLSLPLTIAPNQSLLFSVTFAPSNSGSATGSVLITGASAGLPATISLMGTGTEPSAHSVLLVWDPSPSNVVGYHIYRSVQSPGSYVALDTTTAQSTSFTDLSVSSGQNYWYVVTAIGSGGEESAFSNAFNANIP